MEVRNEKYKNYQTVRQWAKRGCLPKADEQGLMLWANSMHQNCYPYYSPEQVESASEEQLHDFFQTERDRRNQKARERRRKEREQALREQKRQEETALNQAIQAAVSPLEKVIV